MNKVPCGGFKLDENFLGMNENDELSLVGGASEDKAYKQLVTDGDGKAKWEDRLAYDTVEFVEAIAEQSVEFDYDEEEALGRSLDSINISSYANLITDDTAVKVVFDGVEYVGKLTLYKDVEIGQDYFFGNGYLDDPDLPNTGESFCAGIHVEGTEYAEVRVYCNVPGNTHTFGLNIGKSGVHPISYKYIPKNMRVIITADNKGNYTCNVTYAEMRMWYDEGTPVLAFITIMSGQEICTDIEKNGVGNLILTSSSGSWIYAKNGTITAPSMPS